VVSVLGETVAFLCREPAMTALCDANCGGHPSAAGPPTIQYVVASGSAPSSFALSRAGVEPRAGTGGDEFLFTLEQDLTVELQRRRPELLFLHAAVLAWHGAACLLVGASGIGKSTMAWALVHDGFRYLSDELAPVDLVTFRVHPYPRALCLKRIPADYPVPDAAVDLGRATYVPTKALPTRVIHQPLPIERVFLLGRAASTAPLVRELGRAEALARLYPHVLNALAHPGQGLDAVERLVDRVPCSALDVGRLRPACAAIRATLEPRSRSRRPGRRAVAGIPHTGG
jgi:hypothetical protein